MTDEVPDEEGQRLVILLNLDELPVADAVSAPAASSGPSLDVLGRDDVVIDLALRRTVGAGALPGFEVHGVEAEAASLSDVLIVAVLI